MKSTIKDLLELKNYTGKEILAHPISGEKQTSKEWAGHASNSKNLSTSRRTHIPRVREIRERR